MTGSDGNTQATTAIRAATLADAERIRDIYNFEVLNTVATFDIEPRSLDEQRSWLQQRSGAFAAIVAVDVGPVDEPVIGFGALSPYKERAAYRTSVENSVYVDRDHARRGVGRLILTELIHRAATSGFHAVFARISASGEASIGLHEACGFGVVGVEREVGRKFNRWQDVVIMQLLL